MQTIHVNPVSPQALIIRCAPSSALPDMSLVQSSSLVLSDPNGDIKTLAATISDESATSLTLTHLFALGDVSIVGTYSVYPLHTLAAGGAIRGNTQQFQVLAEFA